MVRIPTLTRRNDSTVDRDADGSRIDDQRNGDDRTGRHATAARATDSTDRGRTADARRATGTAVVQRPAVAEPATTPAPHPRASGLATLGLVLGLVAAGAVATGVLAAPGVGVGLLGTLVAIAGVAATKRAHVTGRFDTAVGLLLSLGAVVVGLLALGNAITWPDTDTNQVTRLVDWLNAQVPWLDRF